MFKNVSLLRMMKPYLLLYYYAKGPSHNIVLTKAMHFWCNIPILYSILDILTRFSWRWGHLGANY